MRVNIGELEASFWDGRVKLGHVQLADPRQPMQNLLQADEAVFQLNAAKVMHKQWVIEQATLKRLQFGTPRTESGQLPGLPSSDPAREQSVLVEIARDQAAALGQKWLRQLESRMPLLLEDNLETVQLARELRNRWPQEFERQRQRALQLRQQARNIREMLQQRSDNPLRDLERFQAALQGAQQVIDELSQAQQSLHQLNRQFQKDKSSLLAARQRDREKIITDVGDLSLDGNSLTELLLGENQTRQVRELVGWIRWFRDAIPDPERDFHPVRARGFDVQFRRQPRFVFRNLELEGEGTIGGQNCKFAGIAKNVSTAPRMLSEPTTIELRGQARSHIQLSAVIDRRTSQKIDRIQINCPKVPVPGQTLGTRDSLLMGIGPGSLSLAIDAEVIDDRLAGKIMVQQTGVTVQVDHVPGMPGGQIMMRSLNEQLDQLDSFNVVVQLHGSLNHPQMQLQSDLGPNIATMLGKALEMSLAESAQEKAAELKTIFDQQLADLDDMYQVNTNEILRLLSSEVTEIADLKKLLNEQDLAMPTFR